MTEAEFAAALLDPGRPTPGFVVGPMGQAAPKRFAVYRNNVAVSQTEALQTAFPVVRKLVGEAFFKHADAANFAARAPGENVPAQKFGGGVFGDADALLVGEGGAAVQSAAAQIIETLEQTRSQLLAYVQPRLVWECTLLNVGSLLVHP